MYTLIGFGAGILLEALVLAAQGDRMRVVAAGLPDTLELRRVDAQWTVDENEPVEFGFMLSGAGEWKTISNSAPAASAGGA